MALSSVGRVR